MLESLVASILNRVLGSYVENFDPNQLQIGLLSGDVKLGGLKLKKGALDQLQLPINVTDGHIGSLVLQIPYSNLKSKPVKVFIEDVFIVAMPDNGYDGDAQERRELSKKLEKLQLWEISSERAMTRTSQGASSDDKEKEKQENFTTSLVTKIIENLQVTIRNIHIRMEEPSVGVAVGATLGELSAVSTNKDWEPAFIANVGSTTHKLATLDSLAFYIDPHLSAEFSRPSTFESRQDLLDEFKALIFDSVGATDVLRPINGQGFITLNKIPETELTPKITADLKFEELSVNLEREQYVNTLKLVDQFNKFFENLKYRQRRPVESVQENPLKWFKYAARTVLDEIRERNNRWTWEYMRQRLDDQKTYADLYKKWYKSGGNVSGLTSVEKSKFEDIQRRYAYEDLVFFRSLAKQALVSEKATQSELAAAKKAATSNQTWSEWLWGAKPSDSPEAKQGPSTEADLTAPLEITEEQRRELLDVLDDSNLSQDSASQILFSLQFSLRSAGVRLKSGGEPLASSSFEGVKTNFISRPDSFLVEMSVSTIAVSDLTHNNRFSEIIRVQNLNSTEKNVPFFWFLFEHHPADHKADSNLFLTSQSVVLVHNARLLESIISFFSPPPDQGDTVDAILLAANKTVEELREQTRLGLEYALEHHKTLNLQLDIKAPTIIIPLDPISDDSAVALLDVGSLEMASELVSQTVLNEVKSKQALKYTADDWKRLESLMYDRFTIKLQDTQILLAQNMGQVNTALGQNSSRYHFLDKTTLQFLLELSIVPNNRSLTRSRMSIKLPNLRATLADVQYILFMKILASATPKTEHAVDTRSTSSASSTNRDNKEDHETPENDESETPEISKLEISNPDPSESHSQKIFEFVFIVNEVRFFVVSGWDSKPLVDMCLHDFSVSFWSMQQSKDLMAVDLSVRDLLITDHIRSSCPMELRKIAESDGHQSESKSQSKLFSVNYRKAASGDMKVKVNLEAMNFVLNADTILAVYDYIMSTFASTIDDSAGSSAASQDRALSETPELSKTGEKGHEQQQSHEKPQQETTRSIEVEVNMSRVSALLADEEKGIVTASMESAQMSVELTNCLKMKLKLGAASIADMNGAPLLSIEGSKDLADFRYETLPPLDDGVTPSGPSLVYLRMGRVKLVVIETPLTSMVGFLMRFTTMKAAYDQSRMMALNQSIQVEPGMFKFDLVVSTPIIVWYQHNDWLKLNLGEVFLQNHFEGSVNTIRSGVHHVELSSSLADIEDQIVPETDLDFKVVHTPESDDATLPLTVIKGGLSPVHVRASEYQYRFVMQFLEALSRISAGTASAGPNIEEVGKLRRQLVEEKQLEDTKALYWWGENFSVALEGTKAETGERPKLTLEFLAPSLDITLDLERKPLAQFGIEEVAFEVEIDNQSTVESNFHILHFIADDLTGSELNKFPRIIPPIKHDGYQVIGRILQRSDQPISVECSIDSPQVILALEYLLLLRKYLEFGNLKDDDLFRSQDASDDSEDGSDIDDDDDEYEASISSSVHDSSEPNVPLPRTRDSITSPATTQKSMMPSISINIVDMYLTVLSNEQDKDSEAIVFKIEQLILNTGDTSTFTLSKVGMFLTRMQSFDSSQLRILDDFSVTASIDNSESTESLRLANIQANMERLVLRISLREIGLILNIMNKVSAICGTNEKNSSKKKKSDPQNKRGTTFFADDHRIARSRARSESNPGGVEVVNSESGLVHETIVATRVLSEQLTAQFEDVRVILIDPIHQLPLTDFCIKPFTLVAKNWSDSVIITSKAEMFVNVHSFTKSAWEPLIDNMEVSLTVTGDTVELSSDTVADIELTPETLELAQDIQSYFADSSLETFQRKGTADGAPYRILNETGFPITIWSESSGYSSIRRRIGPGEEINWSFHNWRELRENLNAIDQENKFGVEIHGEGFTDLRSIPANSVGEHLYVTTCNGEKVRIVIDIWIENHLKYISVRSTSVLRNHTEFPLEILMRDVSSQNREILTLDRHSSKPLPLNFVDSKLLVRRVGDQHWSNKELYWQSLLSGECVTLKCADDFFLAVNPELPDDQLSYPYVFINISVPFQIVNNLPLNVDLRLYSRDTRRESHRELSKAGRAMIHDFNGDNLLLLRVDIEGYTSNKFAVINTGQTGLDFHKEDTLEVWKGRQSLQLKIDYVDLPQGEGRLIVFYSPYVIVNNTNQEFLISGDLNKVISGPESATLWSSSNLSGGNGNQKVTLTSRSTHASTPISLDASGSACEISLLTKDRQRELYLGISVAPGTGRYVNTKIVTIAPRFILCNSLSRPVEFREPGGKEAMMAEPGQRVLVGYQWTMAGKEICMRYADSENAEWSSGFTMANVGKNYVRMIERGKPTALARAEVILESATFFVHISPAKAWPYSIRNFTDHEFMFYQTDPLMDEDGARLLNHSKDDFTPLRYRLPPKSAMPYSWDFPAAEVKKLVLEPVDYVPEEEERPPSLPSRPSSISGRPQSSAASLSESFVSSGSAAYSSVASTSTSRLGRPRIRRPRYRKVQLAEIGELPPANFGGGLVVDLSVIADGFQQALVIAPHDPDASTYDDRTNKVKSEAVAEVEAVDSSSGRMYRVNLKGIGISCINSEAKELVYVTLRNIKTSYHVSDALETISLKVEWIQFDNSLSASSDFPVVIYPTVLPKSAAELAAHPCFSTSLTRIRDDSYGVSYIKHATLLLQEMTIETDEDFLLGVVELIVSLTTKSGIGCHSRPYMPILDDSRILCDDAIRIPEPSGDTTPDIYFEQLHLQPMQLNLSFVRTGSLSSSLIFKDNNAAGNLAFIIDALTLTIGNINDAPLRFNALMVDNVRTQMSNLSRMIQIHYQQEFLYQIHKILGSADIIGNPVGLFNNISSGVMDLFYEPYLGYTLNDRPQEFGIGLAKGGISFMKKSVFGVSDSVSKVTGSLSKGLSAVTFDPRYQSERRNRRTRNRPRHAVYGVKYGFESLYDSFSSGIVGLAEQPMQGAVTDGSAGFFKGLGMGLLGLPTKTTIGLLDMASNISEGIRNTTTVFDEHEIQRVRLPRVISQDGVVRPYNVRESVGQMILHTVRDGKYVQCHYLAHSNITRNKVIVVSLEVVLVATINDMSLEWSLSYDQIQSVTSESTGIAITLVGGSHGPFIPLSDESTRKFIYTSMAKAVDNHNRKQLLESK